MMHENTHSCVVLVPVYKAVLDADEAVSLRQSLLIFGKNHDIVLVTHKYVTLSNYLKEFSEYGLRLKYEYFEADYFAGISGYNRLLLSEEFYQRFKTYDYILICQPDAYVFRDELDFWCGKNYDYIGAPLVGQYTDKTYSSDMDMRVGNGGLSLRKVSTFTNYFKGSKNVFSANAITKLINLKKKPYTRLFVLLLMMLGWRNKPKYVARHWKYNEDDFWSGLLDISNYALKKPQPHEALHFAFERFPSELFKIAGGELPFGCHAWKKYEYEEFWIKYINIR